MNFKIFGLVCFTAALFVASLVFNKSRDVSPNASSPTASLQAENTRNFYLTMYGEPDGYSYIQITDSNPQKTICEGIRAACPDSKTNYVIVLGWNNITFDPARLPIGTQIEIPIWYD